MVQLPDPDYQKLTTASSVPRVPPTKVPSRRMSAGGKGVAAGRVEANINLQGGAKGIPDSEAKSVLQNLVQRGPDSEARSVLQNLALP